jgi:hypothetical protein
MITKTEQNALQLAKRVFEHFTHDALPIAREIIAMEHDLGQSPVNGELNSIPEVKTMDGHDFPVSDISIIGLEDDPAMPVTHMNQQLVYQPEDDLPF